MNEIIFLGEEYRIKNAYSMEQIGENIIIDPKNLDERKVEVVDTKYIFSTWGMPAFSEEEIENLFPNLKVVFYGGGSVQYFARPFLNKGIKVFSAWAANAVPVAEFTVAQILLSNKGFFKLCNDKDGFTYSGYVINKTGGNYDTDIGLLGAGMIGRKVIELLKPFRLNVKVFDPFMTDETAEELGVEKMEIEDIFSKCQIVSNHLANNEDTKGIIDYRLLSSMDKYSTFINTGRGAQVVHKDLIRALREDSSLTALIDVTDPEPLPHDDELWELENAFITPHIAGSLAKEVMRMGNYVYEEYEKMIEGKETQYEVTLEMLETMA